MNGLVSCLPHHMISMGPTRYSSQDHLSQNLLFFFPWLPIPFLYFCIQLSLPPGSPPCLACQDHTSWPCSEYLILPCQCSYSREDSGFFNGLPF